VKKWMPRTLSGWFAVIMLSALVLSQGLAFAILLIQGRIMMADVQRREAIERVAAIARLHARAGLKGMGSDMTLWPSVRVGVQTHPSVDKRSIDHAVSAMLEKRIADVHPREVRATPLERIVAEESPQHKPGFLPFGAARPVLLKLVVSIKLDETSWLNITALVPPVRLQLGPFFITLFLGAAGVTAAAVLAARLVAQPLHELSLAARSLGRVEPLQLARERGPEDVRRLVTAFNEMATRLRKAFEEQRVLLRSIGHDLRTPTTSLRINAEFVEDEELKQRMLTTLSEIERLTNAALDAARGGASGEPVRRVDLASLIEAACDDVMEVGGQVENKSGQSVYVAVRTGEIRRAVRNLIENAVRHAGGAQVYLEACTSGVSVVVEDGGPGIPEEWLDRIAKPFAQLDVARSGPGGHGLGLTIVRAIAERHDGELRLRNKPQGGLRAELWLPAMLSSRSL
jgi:signal transduction histidine kinase